MPHADSIGSSRQEQQQTTTETIPSSSFSYQHFEEDTIDLYELSITLWKNKWLVIAFTLFSALGSLVFALNAPSVYEAETLLLPPKQKDFQSLNILEIKQPLAKKTGLNVLSYTIDSKTVFKKFKQNLKSRKIQKKFIKEKGLIEILAPGQTIENIDEDFYNGFAQLINVESDDELTTLSIKMHDGDIASQLVNDFTQFVDKETIALLVADFNDKRENLIRDIEYTITSKRGMAAQRREDRIIRYLEAAKIADSLGIKKRVDATNIVQNTQLNVDLATASTPLYYLGFEALMTEIQILRNRKSDDAFIIGLRDLQEQLAMLNEVKFEQEKMSSVRIDKIAYLPKEAIEPKRRLIVSIATAVGLVSGIFLVFFIEFIKTQRKRHSE